MDSTDAKMKEKVAVLNKIYMEYNIPLEFYGRLKTAI